MRFTIRRPGLQDAAKCAALAIGVVLAASSDWALVARDPAGPATTICAKSQATCDLALHAIENGWFAPELRGSELACVPQADCFDDRSNCIIGYRGPRGEGFCR